MALVLFHLARILRLNCADNFVIVFETGIFIVAHTHNRGWNSNCELKAKGRKRQ